MPKRVAENQIFYVGRLDKIPRFGRPEDVRRFERPYEAIRHKVYEGMVPNIAANSRVLHERERNGEDRKRENE